MTNFKGVVAGVLAVCLAAFAGCGGDSDETVTASGETAALSKAQYVKQADAICRKANERQETLLVEELKNLPKSKAPSKSEQEDLILNAGVPPLKEAVSSLDGLGGPAGEEEKAEALVDALRAVIGKIEAEPIAFVRTVEGEKFFAPVKRVATDLGLQICGEP